MSDTKERAHNGIHSVLEKDHDYIFVDATMQSWPDADYEIAHRHGVTAYGVTACRPHAGFESAMEDLMEWHRLVRGYENLVVAETVSDIRLTLEPVNLGLDDDGFDRLCLVGRSLGSHRPAKH